MSARFLKIRITSDYQFTRVDPFMPIDFLAFLMNIS